jgi:hypothetical protein
LPEGTQENHKNHYNTRTYPGPGRDLKKVSSEGETETLLFEETSSGLGSRILQKDLLLCIQREKISGLSRSKLRLDSAGSDLMVYVCCSRD